MDIEGRQIRFAILGAPSDAVPRSDGRITSLPLFCAWAEYYPRYSYGKYYVGPDSHYFWYPDALRVATGYGFDWNTQGHFRMGKDEYGNDWLKLPENKLYTIQFCDYEVYTDDTSLSSYKRHVFDSSPMYSNSTVPPASYTEFGLAEWYYYVVVLPHGHIYKINKFIPKNSPANSYAYTSGYIHGEYFGTAIVDAPSGNDNVELSALNRTGDTQFTANWTLPADATRASNGTRVTFIRVSASLGFSSGTRKYIYEEFPPNRTTYTFDVMDMLDGLDRQSFYPYTDKRITDVRFGISVGNCLGLGGGATTSMDFSGPDKPTIDDFEYDSSTGIVSATISEPIGWGEKKKKSSSSIDITECVAMDYALYAFDSRVWQWTSQGNHRTYEDSVTVSFDAVSKGSLTFNDYIILEIQAGSIGIAGASSFRVKNIYISYPSKPIVLSAVVPSTYESDNVILNLWLGSDERHPTTNVKLQKLVSVTYENEADIPLDANWQDTDSEDNRGCVALSIPVADVYPTRGRKTWLRVKAWNMDEELCRYSAPVRLTKLERPARTAADDPITIASVEPYKDGTSAKVRVAWDRYGRDDSNRTELSWSTNEVAWRSTDGPSTFDMPDDTWDDGATYVDGYSYRSSSTVFITGLQEGEQHYVRARRVRDPEDDDANGTTYGPYSGADTVIPAATPTAVTADIPDILPYGEPFHVDWSYTSTSTQTNWTVMLETGGANTAIEGTTFFVQRVLATGNDASTSCDIPWSAVDGRLGIFQTDFISVWVATGGAFVKSERQKVKFANRPEVIKLSDDWIEATIRSQPAFIPIACSEPSSIMLTITSRNAVRALPEGATKQVAGDTVWSGVVNPDWQRCTAIKRNEWSENLSSLDTALYTAETAYRMYLEEVEGATEDIEDAKQAVNDAYGAFPTYPERDDYDTDSEYESAIDEYNDDYEAASSRLEQAQSNLQTAYETRLAIDPRDRPKDYSEALLAYDEALAYSGFIDMTDNDKYVTVIKIDDVLDLINLSTYDISVVATSNETGLASQEFNAGIYTDYDHLAPNPSEYVTVETYETVENDLKTIGARIDVPYFAGMFPDDVFDVYRMVNDKAVLIAENVEQNSTVNDKYSPFGSMNTAYRVATKTPSRSITWFDFPYEHSKRGVTEDRTLRIDWNGKYVELNHCISNSDSYQKDFEATKHLDGSVSGHWNEGAMRTANLSAAVIDVYETETLDNLRDLAEYDGPCFIRTSDGIAYEADVQVGDISESFGTAKIDVSFTASEVNLTSEYMAEVE